MGFLSKNNKIILQSRDESKLFKKLGFVLDDIKSSKENERLYGNTECYKRYQELLRIKYD